MDKIAYIYKEIANMTLSRWFKMIYRWEVWYFLNMKWPYYMTTSWVFRKGKFLKKIWHPITLPFLMDLFQRRGMDIEWVLQLYSMWRWANKLIEEQPPNVIGFVYNFVVTNCSREVLKKKLEERKAMELEERIAQMHIEANAISDEDFNKIMKMTYE